MKRTAGPVREGRVCAVAGAAVRTGRVTTPHQQEREARELIERLRFYADSFYGLPGQPQHLRLTEGQAELLAVDIRKVCNELERVTCTLCGGTGKEET